MSNLYKKNYIVHYRGDKALDILTGKTEYIPEPNNIADRQRYFAIQHYLIKHIEENGKNKIVNNLLKKYYDDFIKYPHLFVDSPLITDGFLNRFIPKANVSKIKTLRDKYYKYEVNRELYKKLTVKRQTLSETEKNRLYSSLIHQMKMGNTSYEKEYETCAKLILNSNKPIKDLNNTELKFYCTYIARLAGKDYNIFPDVHIIKRPPSNGGFESNNIVYVNKYTSYTPTIYEITQTVCHETRHAIQEQEAKASNNKVSFEMASQVLFTKYLNTKDYDVYHINYKHCDIELDAERYGFFYAAVILSNLGRPDLSNVIYNIEKQRYRKRNYYEFMIDTDKKIVSSDHFIVENLNKIIKKHPEELKRFKVLENFYKPNGTPIPFIEMITKKQDQSFGNKGMFNSYINNGIAKDKLKDLKIKKLNKFEKRKLFISLRDIFKERSRVFKYYIYDKDYINVNPFQVRATSLYQLKILENLINYIDENMDEVLTLKEDRILSTRSFIADFANEFKDFKLKYAQNQVLKNDPLVQERVNKLLLKCDNIALKFNRQFIMDRISDLPKEYLDVMIMTPERNKMTLNDYLFYDLLTQMNNSTVKIKGNNGYIERESAAYANDVIEYYKKEVIKKVKATKRNKQKVKKD